MRFLTVWPTVPQTVWARRPGPLPFPLDHADTRIHLLGRHALWTGARALGLGAGDEVLAPAWHHGSEIVALLRAGVTCRFYDATDDLEPDEDELESLLGPSVRALHLIHPLGFPRDAARWRRWCDERGLFLLEDAAQAWLSTRDGVPTGSAGALAIFCLYKTLPVPLGAALHAPGVTLPPAPVGGLDPLKILRHHARAAVEGSVALDRVVFASRHRRQHDPASELEFGDPTKGPSTALLPYVRRLGWPDVAEARRENHRWLLERFGEHVPPPFAEVPDGASPMAFPVTSDNADDVLAALERNGVAGIDAWSAPHPALPAGTCPGAARRRGRTIGLPVHHQLDRRDLARIADALGRAFR